jgi:hypothetical protein
MAITPKGLMLTSGTLENVRDFIGQAQSIDGDEKGHSSINEVVIVLVEQDPYYYRTQVLSLEIEKVQDAPSRRRASEI